jgi:hypothetical protein
MTANLAVMFITFWVAVVAGQGPDEIADMKSKLLHDLTASFRRGHDEGRLLEFEEELSPMFASLPKNQHDNLGRNTARYALHRFFIERHGWSIEGLSPVDAERDATPMSSLGEWMPAYLVNSLEQLLGTSGVTLREMAVLAATFEDLIHREASKRLEDVYELLNLPKDSVLHEKEAFDAIKLYMTMYTSGGNTTVRTKEDVLKKRGGLNLRTKKWLKEVQVKVAEEHEMCDDKTGDCGRLDFKAAARVVEEISEQYRSFNEHECEDLTFTLQAEADSPGKVKLSDFYKEGLHGAWNFTETPEYLNALGALDETQTESHVLIPNYVASRPNCLATSSIYVVCCRSKCESMMTNLEKEIKAPVASPVQIVEALTLPLPDGALSSLEAVAAGNRGLIPLHGHAFAQWLHEIFPQSCPRPHANGVSHVQIESEERAAETGDQVLEADVSAAAVEMPVEEISVAKQSDLVTEESTQLVVYACLAACCVAGAVWASQGVLVEANGLIYTKAKSEKLRMPVLRVSMLSICLIATVYTADKMAVEAAKASTAEIVITVAMLIGFAAAGWTLRKNFQTKPSQLLPR